MVAIRIHANVVSTQCLLDIIKGITNLCSQRFASHTVDDVLILAFRELRSPAEGLPQPDRWNVSHRFTSHELFDSAGPILVHDEFRSRKTIGTW